MNRILILAPRWHDRTVLVADWKIAKDNLIDIEHSDITGKRSFPLPFYISGEKARAYPIQRIRSGRGPEVPMRVIPIDDLDVYLEEAI